MAFLKFTAAGALALPLLLAAAPAATAQTFIKGKVVDTNGVGLGGIDIDGFDSGGGSLNLKNDGTAGDGTFTTEIKDGPGTYDFVFNPPQGAKLLPAWVFNVVCVGTKDLGTITMQPGHLISGRVVDANHAPLFPIRMHAIDQATGVETYLRWNETDAAGNFAFTLPDGTFTLQFDTEFLVGPLVAPGQLLDTQVGGDLALGDVVLQPGFLLSATCKKSNGVGVNNVNVDVLDSATGVKLYTPGDNSNGTGLVDVVVPAGTFDVRFKPSLGDKLVGVELFSQNITGTTNLGTITLVGGFYVSGTVKDALGAVVPATDIDIKDPVTGAKIYTPGDNTDGAGFYKVVVPTGTWDVDFTPPYTVWLKSKVILSVPVTKDTTVNATLDACPAPAHYGTGTAGTGGIVPTLESIGDPPRLGAPNFDLQIANARGGSIAFLVIGTGSAAIPGKGFTLYVNPAAPGFLILPVPLGGTPGVAGAGSLTLGGSIPYDLQLDGLHLFMQALPLDPGAAKGIAATDGLDIPLTR